MKKLLILLLLVISQIANAQFTRLFDFNDTLGNQPHGTVISDGTYLYGMTYYGGSGTGGVLYKVKPDGTGYDTLINFSGNNGLQPNSSLIYDGTYLYGTTSQGGKYSQGTVFRVKTDGSGFSKLLEFAGSSNGSHPSGDLVSDGKYLYGTAGQGGDKGQGTIFKIKPDGSGYSKLYSFGANAYDGTGYSCGTLIQVGAYLYGLTNEGGSSNEGTIYKIDTNGSGYHKVLDFPGYSNDWYPEGALLYFNNYLYGVVHYGGLNGGGIIFRIKPDGSGYDSIHNFMGTNGCTPMSGLITDGIFLYGTTSNGGSGSCNNGDGILYKINPDGTGFVKLMNFNGVNNGKYPLGPLYYDGTFLYGMTSFGGAYGDGLLFKYYPLNIKLSLNGNPPCSNQCKGSAKVSVINGSGTYNYSWNTSPKQTTAVANSLCPGKTYKVTVSNSYGNATDSITIVGSQPPVTPSICGVTVDSLSQHNIIFWDNALYKGSGVDSFFIFREINTNNYQKIGAVSFDSLSFFIDTARAKYFPNTGNPNNGTYRYKIVAHDTCELLSDVSMYHNTIFVNSNNGTFTWNLYTIENTANPVTNYLLLRDDSSNGKWHTVAAVAGTQQTVSDPQFSNYEKTATWRVETQWNITCSPAAGIHKTGSNKNLHLNGSLSNVFTLRSSNIKPELNNMNISLAPDPASSYIDISIPVTAFAEILNLQGQVLSSQYINPPKCSINVNSLPKGIYIVRLSTENGLVMKKFIKL